MQPGHRPFPPQVAPMPLGSTPTRRGQAPMAPMAGAAQPLAPLPGAHHHHLQPQLPLQPHQQPHRYSEQRQFRQTPFPQQQQQQQIHPQIQNIQNFPHPQQHPQNPRHAPAPMPMAPGPHHHHQVPQPMAHPGHPGHHMQQHHMHPQQQAAAAAAAAQQQQAAQQQNMAMEAAKRRSRKPTDKTIPDGVDTVIIGDGVERYRELRDFERRLDATMTRKRLDVVDSIQRPGAKRYKTLRIWISNTVENQPWQTGGVNVDSFDFSTNSEASYRVKIEGRLLDDDDDDDESDATKGVDDQANKGDKAEGADGDAMETDGAASSKPGKQARHHLTQFFRAIVIEYNTKKSVLPENAPKPIEWKRPDTRPPPPVPGQPVPATPPVTEYDELTFKRPGDENVNVTINMFRYDEPERFELDEILADIVDMKEATRAEAVMGLFEYIRLQGLQEDEEKRNFRCDDLLKRLVASDIGYIPMLYEYVNKHIRQLPPVQLVYTIRVDEAFHKQQAVAPPTIYDVRVAVDDPLRAQLRPFVQSPQYMGLLRDVGALDEQLALLVQAISMSKSKHEFLSALAKNPALFVRQWLSSQKRDLEVIMGESVRGVSGGAGGAGIGGGDQSGESWWRRGGQSSVWASQNARESVNLLLAKQPLIPRPV